MTANEIENMTEDIQIIDVRSVDDFNSKGSVDQAINIPYANLREKLEELDRNKVTVTYCNKGVTGNAAQNVLMNHGFKNVYTLSGSHKFYVGSKEHKKSSAT